MMLKKHHNKEGKNYARDRSDRDVGTKKTATVAGAML